MKKVYALMASLVLSIGIHAQHDTPDAIYVWVDGSEVCYRLEAEPTVKFQDGQAILYVNGREELTLDLNERGDLKIVFGQYDEGKDPTGITEIEGSIDIQPSKVNHTGKYIRGGKVIIVKDGKMYDTNGCIIKQ